MDPHMTSNKSATAGKAKANARKPEAAASAKPKSKLIKMRPPGQNPLLEDWATPFKMPPFDRIEIEHFVPAFEKGFAAERKATLVGLFSTQMAYRMCRPYLEAVESAFPSDPSVGVVRVQFEENWAKMMLLRYYIMSRYLRPLYTPEQLVLAIFTAVDCRNHTYCRESL
jgi:hypothetical protein